jgi:hypothetical protein
MGIERIPTTGSVRSLTWDGDSLVDVVGGWRRWSLTGEPTRARLSWGFGFDRLVTSPSGRFHVLYVERGTKAVLLDDGRIGRELNRSYAHAEDYDYPIALGRMPDGREVVAHCPDSYNVIEIEDAATGERLTGAGRRPKDVFHSRLAFSPSGRHLVSAGWLWHPYGVGLVFDVAAALTDASTLDGWGVVPLYEATDAEVEAACWLDDDRIVLATTGAEALDGAVPTVLQPGQMGVWSVGTGSWLSTIPISGPLGTLLSYHDRVVSLYGHPRLIDPATGEVIADWPEVDAGVRSGSYGVEHVPTPVAAVDPIGGRLAVAQTDHIAVIDLGSIE